MVVCVVDSPRLHPRSCASAAFVSESINRVIITGRYLRNGSDLLISETKRYPDTYPMVPLLRREKSGERMKETRPGVTHMAGSILRRGYEGLSGRREMVEDYDDILTLANARNIVNMRCEVNITRK